MDYLSFGPIDPSAPWSRDPCCNRGMGMKNDAVRKAHMKRCHPKAKRFEVCDTSTDTHGPERIYVKRGARWVLE